MQLNISFCCKGCTRAQWSYPPIVMRIPGSEDGTEDLVVEVVEGFLLNFSTGSFVCESSARW